LKYTDPVLIKEAKKRDVEPVHVNQGYTKCSVSIVNTNSIITSDKGIANAAEKRGIHALLIEPDENIILPGVSHGFIGGSTGLVSFTGWALTGSLKSLKSASIIKEFLTGKGLDPVILSNNEVIDIGSILPVKED
jgi:hypothetical protein